MLEQMNLRINQVDISILSLAEKLKEVSQLQLYLHLMIFLTKLNSNVYKLALLASFFIQISCFFLFEIDHKITILPLDFIC